MVLKKGEIKLLSDTPVDEDFFSGQGHTRTAQALAYQLTQLAPNGGAIGLEGSWGSGKSTVIKITESQLKEEKKSFHFFTFDLWFHQTENFRRSFLESYVSWLEKKEDIISHDEAENLRSKIRDRTITTEHDKTSHYSFVGALSIAILPILPLAYMWLSPFSLGNPELKESILINSAVLFILFIYAVWLISWLYNYLKEPKKGLLPALSRSVNIFSKEVDKEVLNQYIRDSDPTSIEFYELMEEIINKDNNIKTVFVFDNIDRLPLSDIPKIWAEVRSVFAPEERYCNLNIVAVVPYDKTLIMKSFGNNDDNESFQEGILEKTFNSQLKVSPPLATDWKKYMATKLKESLGASISEDEKDKIFKLFQRKIQDENSLPTPRSIVSYINSIASLQYQWTGILPIESIALYVTNQGAVEKPSSFVNKISDVSSRKIHIADQPDWQKHIAALIYNVHPDDANEVLLTQPISAELTRRRSGEIEKLSKLVGFEVILSELIYNNSSSWADEGEYVYSAVCENISIIDLNKSLQTDVWKSLGSNTSSLNFTGNDRENHDGFALLVSNQEKENKAKTAKTIIERLNSHIHSLDTTSFQDGVAWMELVDKLAVSCTDAENNQELDTANIKVPSSSSFLVGAAYFCQRESKLRLTSFALPSELENFEKALENFVSNGKHKVANYAIKQLTHRLSDAFKDKLRSLITDTISGIEDNDEGTESLDSLIILDEEKDDFTNIEQTITNGTLFQEITASLNDEKYEKAARLLWLLIRANDNPILEKKPQQQLLQQNQNLRTAYEKTKEILNTGNDKKTLNILSKIVFRFNRLEKIMRLALQKEGELYKKLVQNLFHGNHYGDFDITYMLRNYGKITQFIDKESRERFFLELNERTKKMDKINIEASSLSEPLIYDIANLGSSKPLNCLVENIKLSLSGFSEDELYEAIKEENENLILLLAVKKAEPSFTVTSHSCRKAFEMHAIALMKGDLEIPKHSNEWDVVVRCLKRISLPPLGKDILTKLDDISPTQKGIENFMRIYPLLAENMPFIEHPNISLDRFFLKMKEAKIPDLEEFLKSKSDEIAECYNRANDNIKEITREYVEMGDDVLSSEIRSILDLNKKETNSESS